MKLIHYIKVTAVFILCFFASSYNGFSQAQFVVNGAYIVLNGGSQATPIYLVIHNGATTGIKYNSGGIMSESEFNMVWWDVGTAVAGTNYVVPFYYYPSSSYIPVTYNVSTAGVGATGAIRFSTYHGPTALCDGGTLIADDYCYRPSDVGNMNPAYAIASYPAGGPGSSNDSYYVVDRFWIVDPGNGSGAGSGNGYTAKPDPKITFTYLNSTNASTEVAAPNVAGLDGTLVAQRYNSTTNTWGDYLGQIGTTAAAGGTSTVTSGTSDVTAAGFFRSWTLASQNFPLPIKLTSFTAECNNYYAALQWTTATETNNDHFTIERTQDGINYETIAIIQGAGNSSTPRSYSTTDYSPLTGIAYYRLSQTDKDGATTKMNSTVYTPCENAATVNAFSNGTNTINVQINATEDGAYTLTLVNTLGQIIFTATKNVVIGLNDFKLPAQVSKGIYILRIAGTSSVFTKKVILGPQ